MSGDVLGSPDLLLSYSMIALASLNTIILIITHLSVFQPYPKSMQVPTAEQLKTRTKWTGPAIDKIIAPLGGGVKSSADVIGMAIVRAYAQGDEGEGEEGGEEESYLMCTTGHGKIVRFSLPNRHPRRGLQISAAPQVRKPLSTFICSDSIGLSISLYRTLIIVLISVSV